MDYNIALEMGKVSEKRPNSQITDNRKDGLVNLSQGQQVSGTVLTVEEQITIDFDGQKVTASKEVLPGAVPGERKTFEVVKVNSSEIELRLVNGTKRERSQTIKAVMIKGKDWEKVLANKEQGILRTEKEQSVRETADKLKEIGTKFTQWDCIQLEREGFPAEALTVDGLYEAINRIKSEIADRKKTNTGQPWKALLGEDPFEKGQAFPASVGTIKESDIAARLRKENLPDTTQNIDGINKALALSDTVARLDDKAMKYLIASEADPTIENIYKAYYSGSTGSQAFKLTGFEWSQLEGQVKTVIEDAGYEVNQENLAEARWLIENQLPLTPRTFDYKKVLQDLKGQADKNMVLDRIVEGMKDGAAPKDVSLAVRGISELQRVITDAGTISRDAVTYAVREKRELTIKNLTGIQSDLSAGRIQPEELTGPEEAVTGAKVTEKAILQAEDPEVPAAAEDRSLPGNTAGSDPEAEEQNASSRQEYEVLKAQRQLEELRLKMTLEAAQRLEKKGISVETERLEKVVEELRRLEDSYYQRLLKEAEAEDMPEAVEILKNTTQSMEQLRYVPSAVLGSTLAGRMNQTIPGLLSEGMKLQAVFEKAGTAYETLMTVPNPEYGDSIHKAFARVDSLLSELNIENTLENQRAARILGYNRMEITKETLGQVKAYDMEVSSLIRNLHPAVTVRMIKEGINPLQMPVSELNNAIERMKEEQGNTAEDKFSTYLHRLEKENGITSEERKAYIGLYRLLYNIEKSDGAVLGAVVKADQEVTLANLLTAVQTGRKGGVNTAVDDGFGMLTGLTRPKESISQQLEGMGSAGEGEAGSREQEAEPAERLQYLNRVLKQVTEEASPEKLLKLQQGEQMQGVSQYMAEGGTLSAASQSAEGSGLWENLRDVSLEKLLEQLQETAADGAGEEELHARKVQQIRELGRNAEQSLRFLNDYRMESTPQNIMMANQLLSNGLNPTLRQLKKQSENHDENLEQGLKELDELSDTLIDKSSMNEAFEKLEVQAKTMLEQACFGGVIDSSRLAELKMIGQQAVFLRRLASREFYRIPIETAKGVTNMNLTVLRGSQSAGRVSATVWSEALGDIKAEFSLKDRTLKGFITCSSRDGLGRLQANTSELIQAAGESNVSLKQLDFGLHGRENDSYSYQNPEITEQSTLPGNETERILYRLAKAVVQTVSLAENS